MKTLILLILLMIPVVRASELPRVQETELRTQDVYQVDAAAVSHELTIEERVVTVLRDSGMSKQMQRIILAQAKLESGNFKSRLAVNHNNIFGMLHARKRQTTSLGGWAWAEGRKGYASYASIEQSVRDYLLFKRYHGVQDKQTPYAYAAELKSHRYYGSTVRHYARALEYFMKSDSTIDFSEPIDVGLMASAR